MKGYRWYINFTSGQEEPQEKTYSTLNEVQNAIEEYLSPNFPRTVCGIDMVEDDDGSIELLENIILPKEKI